MEIEHQSLVVKIRFNKQPMPANQNSVKKVSHYQFDTLNVLKKCIQKSSCGNWSSISTLQGLLTNVKDKPEDSQGVVYKIKCCDFQVTLVKPAHTLARDGPNTNERQEMWRQKSHCWKPFKDETSYPLGLCVIHYVFYRLLSTTHFKKLV